MVVDMTDYHTLVFCLDVVTLKSRFFCLEQTGHAAASHQCEQTVGNNAAAWFGRVLGQDLQHIMYYTYEQTFMIQTLCNQKLASVEV